VDHILVIDDASPDDLASKVMALRWDRVRLLRHDQNRGVGGATVTGMLAALELNCDLIVKCDGDGQMDPANIEELLAPLLLDQADHSKGCRFHHSRALRQMPVWRFLGNVGLTFFTKLASGYWNILDPVNGFFATRASVLKKIPLPRVSQRYFFETDLLIRLNIVEARVMDIPLPACYGDERSSLSVTRALLDFPPRLLLGLLRRVFWRYLFFDVSPVAVLGLLGLASSGFGLAFGISRWIHYAAAGIPAPTGTIMLAVLPFILGFQLLLQALVLDIQNTPRPQVPPPSSRIRKRKEDS
jgi:glycosyltransferase involved in cell wall biosynthesis